jgi:general secretion pathway protein D
LENLTVFEKVLGVLNVVPYQIEIEARFVEVSQTDIDSLGLEWLLNDNWEIAEKKSDADKPLFARERVVVEENAGGGGFTRANRFVTDLTGGDRKISDDLLKFTSILTNPELSVILHAMQQSGHSDLLSAPKVTTQSGQQATIKVVTEYIYPTEYTLIEAQGSGGDNAGIAPPAVEPGSFETREVGVILDVLPEVSPDGQMINLTLSPEVVTEPIWHDYGYDYFLGNMGGGVVTTHLRMEQPFFHTRSLQTNLLIYNGATVVMGGMITEVREDVDDRIPILGDIPIIGHLFRSRYEASEKRNLLIFVTARLVDPSGRPLSSQKGGMDKTFAAKFVEPKKDAE